MSEGTRIIWKQYTGLIGDTVDEEMLDRGVDTLIRSAAGGDGGCAAIKAIGFICHRSNGNGCHSCLWWTKNFKEFIKEEGWRYV